MSNINYVLYRLFFRIMDGTLKFDREKYLTRPYRRLYRLDSIPSETEFGFSKPIFQDPPFTTKH